jgi:hypothetical protein
MDAVQWLPRDNKEWLEARDRWKKAVLRSNLTAATKVVAIVIADFYIHRNPQNRAFNWAWAAQDLLADTAGLSRRTVATAMDELEREHLIVIDRGGGRKGDRGRTHRYTLRMDALRGHVENEDVQNLHNVMLHRVVKNLHNAVSSGKQGSCENDGVNRERIAPKEVNGFPTTLSIIPSNDFPYADRPKEDASIAPSKRLVREGSKVLGFIQPFGVSNPNQATSVDCADLAKYIGEGDVRAGWDALMVVPADEVDRMARRYKYDKAVGPEILGEVRRLLAKEGSERDQIPNPRP